MNGTVWMAAAMYIVHGRQGIRFGVDDQGLL